MSGKKMEKQRLDILLVERGLAPSREKAKRMIMAGEIFVDSAREDKPGVKIPVSAPIEARTRSLKYVSRGGFKLEKAMEVFRLDLSGRTCLDIGASTGGFTDCMLQNGAAKVYSIDVGYGQFDYRLRSDPRVVCMERTNFRYLTPEDLPERADFASADVSFISLDKILPPARELLTPEGQMVCLIKPQFEAGREKVGKKGVVRDPGTHIEVIGRVFDMAGGNGFGAAGLSFSPIRGPEGNIEYLIHLMRGRENAVDASRIPEVVGEAHEELSDRRQ